MKALIQRVEHAEVSVHGKVVGSISNGLLILLCAMKGDNDKDLHYMLRKISNLRIFGDSDKKMNLSLLDIKGDALVISQFTLAARSRKGNRPSFDSAEEPEKAKKTYESFIDKFRETGIRVESGEFGADMKVEIVNDGPVTLLIDSREEKD
ncbi:MAG: D-tyrosyl-tRNA(Tyr) deacylase [Nitrospirota bacterium]|nr:MAG: D-tyrosyl-tRNA(Tyr) deacylase [Nitrospirota bacterium]